MCTILFFTKLRVGELKLFNRGKIMELINAGRTDIFQPKTHSLRSVLLSKYGRQTLKELQVSIDTVCPDDEISLYPMKEKKGNKIAESINSILQKYGEQCNL